MPYLEIQLNDVVIACAGDNDIAVLTAHVIAGSSGDVSVGVHGMRVRDSKSNEHFDWLSQSLRRGDRIDIGLLLSAKPTAPRSHTSHSADPSKIAEELEEMKAHFRRRFPDGIPELPRAADPIVLRVSIDQQPPINAAGGDEEQLQVVLNWSQQGCVLEVDSLTVLNSGYTKGQRWLREKLVPGQRLQITYAT